MWKQLGLGLMCLFAVISGADLRGSRNETDIIVQRVTAIKPWYRNAAEKARAVRLGAGLPVNGTSF